MPGSSRPIETILFEQIRLSKLVLDISTALVGQETLCELLTSCTDAFVRHMDAAFARIWSLNEEEQVLELQASSGMYTHLDGGHSRVPVGKFKIGLIAAEHRPHLTNSVPDDPRVSDKEWARREGMVAFAGYPLLMGDRLIGVIAMFSRQTLSDAALQSMATVANGIALGIVRVQLREERTSLLELERSARAETELARKRLEELNASLEAQVAERTMELQLANIELKRSNQELEAFAYVASHDLQEPLRKVQAFSNLLEEEFGEQIGEGKMYLERMRQAAARMSILINDLLTFARVTSRAQPFTGINLTRIAQEVIGDLESRVQMMQATIDLETLPTIEADPLQMRQLLQNLLSNALKFARNDIPPIIKIYTQNESFEPAANEPFLSGPLCRFVVEDNGIGFDEKYTDRIFAVFQRLHGKNAYPGTGIGLAIVRKIVERHGGTIGVKSKPYEGASFIVTLPIHNPHGK